MPSRCVGAVSAVLLGTAVERGGTTTAASMALGDAGGDIVLSYALSPVNDATEPATCPSKGPTWEPSSTSLPVSEEATIRPVSASTPMCSFRQDRRVRVLCFDLPLARPA